MNIYGITVNGIHTDTSKTLQGAKNYATRNNFLTVSVRYSCGYIVRQLCHKYAGKWIDIK
jgi:hypothetical protein